MSLGQQLLSSLIHSEKGRGLECFSRLQLIPQYFAGDYELQLFKTVDAHVRQYGALPSPKTLKAQGFEVPTTEEPPEFYAEKCQQRYVFRQLRSSLELIEKDMNEDRPKEALERMLHSMTLCQTFVQRNRMVNFQADGLELVQQEYIMTQRDDYYAIDTGWPYLDELTGGLRPGDVYVIVGRPGAGKTYAALTIARKAWEANFTPMVVSMEMRPIGMLQRLTAMTTKKPITKIRQGQLTHSAVHNMLHQLRGFKNSNRPPFWVMDGAFSATVEDTVVLARQLRPAIILIDGAYMMKLPSWRGSRWERLTEVVERVKQDIAMALNVPVVVTYQFNREKGEKSLDHIGGADAVGQIASVVLGLLKEKSIETLRRRTIEILKGREGETGQFDINWVFDTGPEYMDFSQIQDSDDDLQWV